MTAWRASLTAATLMLAACNNPPQGPASGDKAAEPGTPPECDMSGMDMSKVTAQEHQKMMEDCARARRQQKARAGATPAPP